MDLTKVGESANRAIPWFGARKMVRELLGEVRELRVERDQALRQLEQLGAMSIVELEKRRLDLHKEFAEQAETLARERGEAIAELEAAKKQLQQTRQDIVTTEDLALLQEAGVYHYRHPLSDAVAYQRELDAI